MTPPQQHHEHQFTPPVQPSFQQVITQQQQARAAARRQGITDTSIPDSVSGDHDRQTQPRQSEQTTAPGTPPSQTLSGAGSADTLAHEDQRPSGQSWRITVNGGSLAIPSAHMGHGPIPQPNTMPLASFGAHGSFNVPADALSSSMASPRNEAGQPLPTPSSPPTQDFDLGNRVRIQTVLPLQQRLLIVERIVASGHAPPEDQVNELRSRLEELRRHRNNIPDGLERSLTARIVNVSNRAEQIRRSAGRNVTSPPRTQQPPAPTQTSATPLVYLLSSPSGPHALLISPSGLFSTAPRTVPLTNDFRPFTANIPPQRFNQAQVPVPFANNLAQQPVAHEPPIHEQGAQQQPGQARDIARILLPLGGHLWLLIRLFGFVYLFTGGGGWRRAILLGIGAFVVFIAQIGIFHPVQQAVWEPLRRHLEGLVPLAGNGRANARVAPGAAAAAGIDGEQRALGEESLIRQAAERLLRERDQRNVGLVRQNLRRLERAVAIFLASLVPGVGERHIAARDAAEAVRMVEELERAEERVREEQSRGEDGVEESLGNEAAPTAMASGSNEDDGSVGHSQQPQQDQQPLVDI